MTHQENLRLSFGSFSLPKAALLALAFCRAAFPAPASLKLLCMLWLWMVWSPAGFSANESAKVTV